MATEHTALDDLILNAHSRQQLRQYLAQPTHALMLTGPEGVGLGTIARTLGWRLAGPNTIYIAPTLHNKQKTTIINADDIAELGSMVRSHRSRAVVVILDGADQAVNGVFERMLKLIEEPVDNVYYIFTAHSLGSIPATILSRSALINIKLPSATDCTTLYDGLDRVTASQVKFAADRRPAEIKRLLTNSGEFDELTKSMQAAKEFLQGNVSKRLTLIDGIADKDAAIQLCRDVAKLVGTLAAGGRMSNGIQVSRQLDLLAVTVDRLTANGNQRLQLVNLAVNFGAMV